MGRGQHFNYANQESAVLVLFVTAQLKTDFGKSVGREVEVKEKVFRGLEERADSQRARGNGAWESGEVRIVMCHNNVVLDTPKHHGTQAKQQNHLHFICKLVRKS